MEKINLVKLLKDCPKGMELDCTIFEDVTLYRIDIDTENEYPIRIITKNDTFLDLTKYGTYSNVEEAKCVIFPKGKTTWEGFVSPHQFKDGDIVISTLGNIAIISNTIDNKLYNTYCGFYEHYHLITHNIKICVERFATEEERQKLFDAIKDDGYRWNNETKTLEKLIEPKFKVGDRIRKENNNSRVYTINGVYSSMYGVEGRDLGILIEEQDEWELVPNKFDINNLKPFAKVLVRDGAGLWRPNLFGKDMIIGYRYFTANGSYKECIPYEGNEHLLGTTDNCDDFYKNW